MMARLQVFGPKTSPAYMFGCRDRIRRAAHELVNAAEEIASSGNVETRTITAEELTGIIDRLRAMHDRLRAEEGA